MNNQSTVAMHIAVARKDHMDKQANIGRWWQAAKTGLARAGGAPAAQTAGAAGATGTAAGAAGASHLGTGALLGGSGAMHLLGTGVEGGKELAGWAIPAIIAAPPLAALTAAALVSAATSPAPIETQTAQGELEGAELDEALAELRRRRSHRLKTKGKTNAERSLFLG